MKLSQITDYNPTRKCKTPDAVYSSDISGDKVSMSVELPFKLSLDKDESLELEAKLHYAIEQILAKYFKKT